MVVDPHAEPLARWSHNTHNAGMLHLRSPEVHNLDVDPLALGHHAKTEAFMAAKYRQEEDHAGDLPNFIPPYSRPSLRLFMHHVQSLVERNDLMRLWKSARATDIQALERGYRVRTDSGEAIEADNVVLALGAGDQPKWPPWALEVEGGDNGIQICHIFDPAFSREQIAENSDVAIVGAGISAAQLALALLDANPDRQITLVSRHFLRKQDFDSDPGWLGPTLLKAFHREPCYIRRRTMIQNARNRGSLASEVHHRLQTATLRDQSINLELAEIDSASYDSDRQKVQLQVRPFELDPTQYEETGDMVFQFAENTQVLEADTVVLATGFEPRRPGGTLLDDAIRAMHLPVAKDGYPIVDRHLRWRRGLFVMGPLAELEVGPASRNLSGARMAAERIIHCPEAYASAESLASVPMDPSPRDPATSRELGTPTLPARLA